MENTASLGGKRKPLKGKSKAIELSSDSEVECVDNPSQEVIIVHSLILYIPLKPWNTPLACHHIRYVFVFLQQEEKLLEFRRIRAQQDSEFLASSIADREKVCRCIFFVCMEPLCPRISLRSMVERLYFS
jgi:hypothetical protein